jgi:Xaa-Pro aminopeptidase
MVSAPQARTIPASPDLERMRADRVARLRATMREQGVDALILLGNTNVVYATGAIWPLSDVSRISFERPVAVVLADDELPHLFSPFRADERLRAGLPDSHYHGPAHLDFDEGVELFLERLSEVLPGPTIAIDEWTHALRRAGRTFSDGGRIVNSAKALKTPDELACMREGLRITETAMREVQQMLAPGVRQTDLTATFLRTIFEAGADANILDPIWQVMPSTMADGPWTTTGGIACPLLTTPRELQRGDVMWVDAGISYEGFHTDFGRTWIVGNEPSAQQREQFDKWRSIMDSVLSVTRAGAMASDLTAAAIAANGGEKPWMPHFYLGHGLGIDAAEHPFVGSDIGEVFDAQLELQAGMVLVLEPIVWEDGAGGYRSEEILLITEDGWEPMTDYSYEPF